MPVIQNGRMRVQPISALAVLLPFAGVHLSYLVAASYGHVDWCIPYIDSCTSISATGRQPPASFVFRATMIPSAMILMAFWWINHQWLTEASVRYKCINASTNRAMLTLGILASLGLIAYVTVLGEVGRTWQLQRRAGVILFFSFTYLAQLLFVSQLRRLHNHLPGLSRSIVGSMMGVCITLLSLGILTVILDMWDEAWYDTIDDAFEWILALLLQCNFLLMHLIWNRNLEALVFVSPSGRTND